MATHSSILPGEFHRQKSLAGYSPWGLTYILMIEMMGFSDGLDVRYKKKESKVWSLSKDGVVTF